MTRTNISRTDLSHRTGEIVDRVQHGELAVVESDGQEQVVLLDAMDYRQIRRPKGLPRPRRSATISTRESASPRPPSCCSSPAST
jgi:prevent-host-death family protein